MRKGVFNLKWWACVSALATAALVGESVTYGQDRVAFNNPGNTNASM